MAKVRNIRKASRLNHNLFEICLGVLLGDASLQKNTSISTLKHRIKFSQGAVHKCYAFHLHDAFRDFVISPPYYNAQRKTYSFQTVFHEQFNRLADIFFEGGGKKKVTNYFKHHTLSACSVAYGFMDDEGLLSYNKDYPRRALVFNSQGFTRDECETLAHNLNRSFEISSWVKPDGLYYYIVVPAKDSDRLRSAMDPYIVESMKHKPQGIVGGAERKVDDIV